MVTECEMKDCAPWVIPPDALPPQIKSIIGTLDIQDEGPSRIVEMQNKLSHPSTPSSLLVDYLAPALATSIKSETKLYPLAHYLLLAGGMNRRNGFNITTHEDPQNKIVIPFGPNQNLSAILDIAAWYRTVGGPLAFGCKVEVKFSPSGFNYAQFVGQLLLQSLHEMQHAPMGQQVIETCGISVCGFRFRLATLKCPVSFLYPLTLGEVQPEGQPTLQLSRTYNLLSAEERAWALGAIFGRTKCFVEAPEQNLITIL